MDIVTLGAALNGSKAYTDQVTQSLAGSDIGLAGYTKGTVAKQDVSPTDNVNQGLGKIEKRVSDNENNISLKANTSDVNTATANLQTQIDEIAQATGTGSADTEVAQARVGTDGTSYQTLKARLDGENSELKEDLSEVNKKISDMDGIVNELGDLMLPTLIGGGTFSVPYKVETFTDIELKNGKTYVITYDVSIANSITAYAKNNKTSTCTLTLGKGSAELTPTADGVLTFYTSSSTATGGSSITVSVNEKRTSVSDLVEKHNEEIQTIKSSFGGDVLVGSGTFDITKSVILSTTIHVDAGTKYYIAYNLLGSTYVNVLGATSSDSASLVQSDCYIEWTPTTTGNIRLYTSNANCTLEIYVYTKRKVETDNISDNDKPRTPTIPFYNINADGNMKSYFWDMFDIYKYPPIPIWGMEYLASWYNKIYNGEEVKIDFEGDSITWYGYRVDCVKRIMEIGEYPQSNIEYINNGYGNRSTNEWAGTGDYYTHPEDATDFPNGIIAQGIATNSDLMICGYGINDAVIGASDGTTTIEERLAIFESNYREVLNRIRGNSPVNGRPAYNKSAEVLPIILCMPTFSNRDYRHNEQWHMYIRTIIQKLCREYQCAFCDFSLVTWDEKWSTNNIWSRMYDDGSKRDGLHPTQEFTMAYASILQPLIYPVGLWKNNQATTD